MITPLEIQQARSTADTKLSLHSYSGYLKSLYGMADHCGCDKTGKLLLVRFALYAWDTRAGAVNVMTLAQIYNIIKILNSA